MTSALVMSFRICLRSRSSTILPRFQLPLDLHPSGSNVLDPVKCQAASPIPMNGTQRHIVAQKAIIIRPLRRTDDSTLLCPTCGIEVRTPLRSGVEGSGNGSGIRSVYRTALSAKNDNAPLLALQSAATFSYNARRLRIQSL